MNNTMTQLGKAIKAEEAPRVIVADDVVEFPPLKPVKPRGPGVKMAGEVEFPRLKPDTTVCFLNGTWWQKTFVKSVVNTHYNTIDMNVRFRFVEPTDPFNVPIRIAFHDQENSGSIPHRVAREIGVPYTMVLNLRSDKNAARWQHEVLHEFGRFLGLKNQHQYPDSGIEWNKEFIKGKYGISERAMTENFTGHIVPPRGASYDRDSIMHYEISPSFAHNITETIRPSSVLSQGDKELIKSMYPLWWSPEEIQQMIATNDPLPAPTVAGAPSSAIAYLG